MLPLQDVMGSARVRSGAWLWVAMAGLTAAAPAAAQVGMCQGNSVSPASPCYRLLCNGAVNYLPETGGPGIRNDECSEACDLNTPSRWPTPFIDVTVEQLTAGVDNLSPSDWNTVVSQAMGGWNSVASSNLELTQVGTNVSRSFGGNQSLHEVFWIKTQSEFEQKVGQGVFGALGVTLARYDIYFGPCGNRDIYDADLVMNGVPAAQFNWAARADDCPAGYYCSNALGTLIHELGHFVGVGHPCADNTCESWAVMAASSAPSYLGEFNPVENLRTADFAVAEALYPGVAGGLGSACNGTCNTGFTCQNIDGNQFCTQSCTNDSSCAPNLVCDTADTGLCVFPGSVEPGVGEGCTNVGASCAQGAGWCLGPTQGEGVCYQACNPQAPNCAGGDDCVAFQGEPTEGFCIGLAGPGEFCDNQSVFCENNLACVDGGCRAPCDPVSGGGCGGGLHCAYLWDTCDPGSSGGASSCYMGEQCPANSQFCNDVSFCIPAGAGQEGDSCDANNYLSCGVGKVCLSGGPGTSGQCFARCDQSFSCNTGQTCYDINDPGNPDQVFLSYCSPIQTVIPGGDGDGDGDAPGDGDGDGDGDAPGDGDGDGDNPGDGDGDGDGPRDATLDPPPGECNLARGHWDCPEDQGCVDDGDGDTFGVCSPDADIGDLAAGRFCEGDNDCYGGLCVEGVCTRPCNVGCETNYECVAGVCEPLPCASGDDCSEDYNCVESGLGENICAKETGSTCSCVALPGGDADAGGPMGAAALLGGLALAFRRRRR